MATVKKKVKMARKKETKTVAEKSVPVIATEIRKCADCGSPFEIEKKRGRPATRCPKCREARAIQKDTSKTTSQRIAAKRSQPPRASANGLNHSPTVVAEEFTDNDRQNHEAARGEAKALLKALRDFGWAVKGTRDDATLLLAINATRGNETLHMEWRGGKLIHALGGDVRPK